MLRTIVDEHEAIAEKVKARQHNQIQWFKLFRQECTNPSFDEHFLKFNAVNSTLGGLLSNPGTLTVVRGTDRTRVERATLVALYWHVDDDERNIIHENYRVVY